jgi:protein-tyrosine-phosphatase
MTKILVICLGNLNRSPLCAHLLQRAGFDADSAGFRKANQPAARKTREWARQNLNLTSLIYHRSKVVTQELLDAADLIILMTPAHTRYLEGYNVSMEKIRYLGAYLNPPQRRIPDPGYISFGPKLDKALSTVTRATQGLIAKLRESK